MPIYVYKAKEDGCDSCKDGFEVFQTMSEKELTKCPQCGQPIKKVPANFGGGEPSMSNSKLRDLGFTKLVKRGDGSYENVTKQN
ncbi:MAG: zinc ribbon domain-containing protein [Phycisphaerae bacterium]|nr:zinc ribbon domain-containing protein [Phycisphaerae bacterium]